MDDQVKNWAYEVLETLQSAKFELEDGNEICHFIARRKSLIFEVTLDEVGLTFTERTQLEEDKIPDWTKVNHVNATSKIVKVGVYPKLHQICHSLFYPAYADPNTGFELCLIHFVEEMDLSKEYLTSE